MEYLRQLFEEEISSEEHTYVDSGRVHIRERHWTPVEVLGAFGNETYKEIFDSWRLERQDALVAKGEEILAEFDQVDRFAALKAAYKRGSVTPFVGAGLSMSSGYPGWSDFILRIGEHTDIDSTVLKNILARGEYESAAQLLFESLGVGFNEELENTFAHERDLRGPVQLLPYLFSGTIITTNFDDVLKRSYENAKRSFSETVSGADLEELARLVATGRPLLVKMHGKATSGRGRVLTRAEYDIAYRQAGAIDKAIQLLCTRTLLFLGCSLTVDRFISAMGDYLGREGHDKLARHYAFMAAPNDTKQRTQRKKSLANFNIYPIWYPDGEHDESLEALLHLLAQGVMEL